MEGFEYVVNPVPIPKIAFGSGLERQILPLTSGQMSPFMRRHMGESNRSPGPAAYNNNKSVLTKNYPSLNGFSAFANKCPRLPALIIAKSPNPTTYDIRDKPVFFKQCFKPFHTGAERKMPQAPLTPASPTYSCHLKRPQMRVNTAFGSIRKFTPYVAVVCSPKNYAKCYLCGKTPYGDYWHSDISNQDLCRYCMNAMKNKLRTCNAKDSLRLRLHLRRKIDEFKPIRYCGFLHDHNGTTSAIQVMSSSDVKLKLHKENYLALFM